MSTTAVVLHVRQQHNISASNAEVLSCLLALALVFEEPRLLQQGKGHAMFPSHALFALERAPNATQCLPWCLLAIS